MTPAARLFALGLVLLAAPAAAEQPRAVLELFTSQGCSSCPKADRLANELAGEKDLIVLTFPVDYWDYLGWKDTLGSAAHTARQEGYARARGGRGKFTPEMIINGAASATGSDRAGIMAAIDTTGATPGLFAVPVSVEEEGGQIAIELAESPGGEGEVWLFALASSRTVDIESGENESRTAHYSNVVRKMTRLGAFSGKPVHFTIPRTEAMPDDADCYVVLVQSGSGAMPGAILGVNFRR